MKNIEIAVILRFRYSAIPFLSSAAPLRYLGLTTMLQISVDTIGFFIAEEKAVGRYRD
jgi:hypothetical protein